MFLAAKKAQVRVDVEDVRGVGGGTFTNNDYDEYDDFM
jgi:hypothetical protein